MIVDDGVKDRGHREAIFDRKNKNMGCFSGTNHPNYQNMTTAVYVDDFIKEGEPDPRDAVVNKFFNEDD